ncbi:MAG TPA: hypothetical protein VM223_19780 [Planctomycetota bacterium]|nr:hypothetical protein [Planctomycetota bacterium]
MAGDASTEERRIRAVRAVPERWCLMAVDASGNRFPGVRRRVKGAGL